MSDATIPILGGGTTSAPQDYRVKGGQVLGLEAVRAQFDGSGAAGAFLPCVQIVSAAGNVMSQTLSDSVAAGASADVTFHPFRKKATSAATAAALPWCEAFQADYVAADFFFGTSPDPLNYKFFAGNDATAFAFNNVGIPAANNGFVQILRSGYYRVRLIVSPVALLGGFGDPGYLWDLFVQVRAVDNGGNFYFGPGGTGGGTYLSEGSYALLWSTALAAPQTVAPNFPSIIYPDPHPAGDVYLNLDDSVVNWPVTVYNRFRHGLNDAQVQGRGYYYLQVVRLGDANPAGYTG